MVFDHKCGTTYRVLAAISLALNAEKPTYICFHSFHPRCTAKYPKTLITNDLHNDYTQHLLRPTCEAKLGKEHRCTTCFDWLPVDHTLKHTPRVLIKAMNGKLNH